MAKRFENRTAARVGRGAGRLGAGIAAGLLLFVLLFSAVYIAVEANHECEGEDCPICECIVMCESTLRLVGDALTVLAAAFVPTLVILLSVPVYAYCAPAQTPVSRHIRLND